MNLQELIKTRINENVASYDINIIERYEYLIEMIAIEYQSKQLRLCEVGVKLPTDTKLISMSKTIIISIKNALRKGDLDSNELLDLEEQFFDWLKEEING